MTKHPQLQKFIDALNKPKEILSTRFVYKDGHEAILSTESNKITITTTNPKLITVLGSALDKLLRGNTP